MELANELFTLGAIEGYRERKRERKMEAEHDQDRAFTLEQRERTRKQWSLEDADAGAARETRKLQLGSLRAKAEREGAYEFLEDINAGVAPQAAAQRYNARGSGKIDPASIKFDPASRAIEFSSMDDQDGDGKPDTTRGHLDKMIAGAQQILGRTPKQRYINTPDGSSVFDTQSGKFVANNAKDTTARTAANRPIPVKADQSLINPTSGKSIYKGPQFGKPKPATGGEMVGGRKLSPFNPETYNRDLQGELARFVGGKYDPTTLQFDYGAASKKMPPFTQAALEEASRINRTLPGEIPAAQIAAIVAGYASQFDEDAVREGAREQAMASGAVKSEGLFGLGKPNPAALKTIEDAAVKQALSSALGNIRKDIAEAEIQARTAVRARQQAQNDAATDEEEPDAEAPSTGRAPSAAPKKMSWKDAISIPLKDMRKFASEAEVDAALTRGEVQRGDYVVVDGRRARVL